MKKKILNVIQVEQRYIDFPWASVSGYFNGDIFEDWLKTDVPEDHPDHDLKRFFRHRDKQLYQQVADKIKQEISKWS